MTGAEVEGIIWTIVQAFILVFLFLAMLGAFDDRGGK